MKIDYYTKLKPYDALRYSPVKRPPKIGELAITLDHPRGYAVVVESIQNQVAFVAYLDDVPGSAKAVDLRTLIPTGKTPSDLLSLYEPTPVSLDEAVDKERQLPDFSLKKTRTKGGAKKKEPKSVGDILSMSSGEKAKLKEMLKRLLKGGH